jgi:hypothetical protein
VREAWLLSLNAASQIIVSSTLGFAMLVPMQPWGRRVRLPADRKALLAAHLDWLMLAFMQLGAAFVLERWALPSRAAIGWLLIFGGWMNPVPYLLRGMGIDAFVLAGPARQRVAATIAGTSALAILVAWVLLAIELARAHH